jgi:hypothetical protein
MTISIEFGELWTYKVSSTDLNLPLSALPDDGRQHVHGRLQIHIADKLLEGFGFHDACLSEWLSELISAVTALATTPQATYTYDGGEQGQPALHFQRRDERLLVSVEDSSLSDGLADPDFQNVECDFSKFVAEVAKFRHDFEAVLYREAPHAARQWLVLQVECRA